MSTRVEKGGPKFRPVLKSRSRPPPSTSAPGPSRPSIEPTQAVLSQRLNIEETDSVDRVTVSQELPVITVSTNESNQSSITSSPSKPSGTPIVISNPKTRAPVYITSQGGSATPNFTSRAPFTAQMPAVDTQPSDETPRDAAAPGRSTVSQKQPKQTHVEAEGQVKKRVVKRTASKKGAEDNVVAETVSASPRKRSRSKSSPKDQETAQSNSKRRRSEPSGGEDSAQVDDGSQSDTTKKRRRRKVVQEGNSTESIDPTQITMGAICDDLGSGRKSSRWESSQTLYGEARKRAKEERTRIALETEQQERETGRLSAKRLPLKSTLPSGDGGRAEGQRDEFSYDETLKASHYAPQVRIGANGEIVLDVDSLQVDRSADPDLVEEYSHIEENDHTKFTNSGSWSKRRLVRWGKEDTALFYDALRQFGQNFDLIARILPGKTYRMCKNKFKAEDKKNPALIDEALRNAVAVDLNTLSRMTGKDFTGPPPTITARPTLTLGDIDESTTQMPADHATETAITEGQDKQAKETVTESTAAPRLPAAPESPSVTTRHTESPPPADTLFRRSTTAVPDGIQVDTSQASHEKDRLAIQGISVGVPRRVIPVLPVGQSRKR